MSKESFQIEFERSGGFTGTSTRAAFQSEELEVDEAEELNLLIERSGFFEAMVLERSYLNMPDQFRYQISIEHGGKKRKLELAEGSIPDTFRPLINRLVRLARKHRRF
jgi:hypothetical protein